MSDPVREAAERVIRAFVEFGTGTPDSQGDPERGIHTSPCEALTALGAALGPEFSAMMATTLAAAEQRRGGVPAKVMEHIAYLRIHFQEEMERVKGAQSGWPMVETADALSALDDIQKGASHLAAVQA